MPQIQIYGGGAHARGRVDVQDYMVICIGAGSFAEAAAFGVTYRTAYHALRSVAGVTTGDWVVVLGAAGVFRAAFGIVLEQDFAPAQKIQSARHGVVALV